MKKLLAVFCILLALCLVVAASAETVESLTQEELDALEVTTVFASDASPTGYYVTFRYKAPDATRVRIYGEWSFTDPLYTSVNYSQMRSPQEWKNGDTVYKVGNWPTVDMTKNDETGVWSYTIPLPSGTWGYYFYVGGDPKAEVTDYTDTEMVSDPNNLQLLATYEGELIPDQVMSFVYVPYDAQKQTLSPDLSVEAPRDGENGETFYVTLEQDEKIFYYGVYLPYGFDAEREEPYPILTLIGNAYSQWIGNGTITNILDNMIAEGKMEPTILVTLTGEGDEYADTYDLLLNQILPDVSGRYNGSTDPNRRAIGGLSASAARSMYAYFHHTDEFQYYIIMSPPMKTEVEADYTIEGLAEKTLFIGFGDYDQVLMHYIYNLSPDADGNMTRVRASGMASSGNIYEYIYYLGEAGISFQSIQLPYGHDWVLWRQLAAYAFENVLWK